MYMLDPMMNLVDIGIVAQMGTAPLAGVGMASTQVFFAANLFSFLNVLTVPSAAKAYLNKEIDELSKVVGRGMWIAVGSGIVLSVFVYALAPQYIAWMNATPEVGFHALEFAQARAIGMPLVTISYVFTGVFRGCQDTLSPLIAQIGAIAMNLMCDVLFVFVFGWGVAGSAWATVLSYAVSDIWLLTVLIKQKGIKYKLLLVPPKIYEVISTLVQGAALSTRTFAYMAFILISGRSVAKVGPSAQAAQEIVRQLFVIFSLPQWAIQATSVSVVSKYLGLKQRITARDAFYRCGFIAMLVSVVMGSCMVVLQTPFIHKFTQDPNVIGYIGGAITIIACLLWLDGMASVMEGALQANSQTQELAQVAVIGMTAITCILYIFDWLNLVSLVFIWAIVRVNSLFRVLFGWKQVFFNQPDFKQEELEYYEQLKIQNQKMAEEKEEELKVEQINLLIDQQNGVNQFEIMDEFQQFNDDDGNKISNNNKTTNGDDQDVLLAMQKCSDPPCTQQA